MGKGFRSSSIQPQFSTHPRQILPTNMLSWTLTFLLIAIVAGVLGFTGIAGAAASIAQTLFYIFLVLLLVSLIAALMRGGGGKPNV